jgi:uncharacterized phage protein gp47/JayE
MVNDVETEFCGTIPAFGKVWVRVFVAVLSALLWVVYLWIAFIQKNILPDTADPETQGGTLERWGRIKLGRDPFPAKQGQYECTVTGAAGSLIPANTTFKSDGNSTSPGRVFAIDADYSMPGSTGTIIVRALVAGTGSKLAVGDTLTIVRPLAGINNVITVTSEYITPLQAEDTQTYRDKIGVAFRLEPQGGAAADFRLWGLDAAGVKQIYPYITPDTATEVDVYVEALPEDSLDGQGTPTSGTLTDVTAVIEQDPDTTLPLYERGRRPLGVWQVNVMAVSVKQVEIIIAGLTESTTTNRANIEAGIREFLAETRPFVDAIDTVQQDTLDIPKISNVIIQASPTSTFTSVTIKVNTVSYTTYQFVDGNIPYLTSVSFV